MPTTNRSDTANDPTRRQRAAPLTVAAVAAAAAAALSAAAATAGAGAGDPPWATPPGEGGKTTNAAQARYGARVSVAPGGPGGSRDPGTPPEATFDGNVHSRCVLRGDPPYTFTVELPFAVPVRAVAFAHSDYARERAPREVEVSLDGGPPVRHALELRRPEKRRPAWQEVSLGGREARVVRVTVLSDHAPDPAVNWGGLGEIAVLTTADLDARFALPAGAAAAGPSFVHVPGASEATAGGKGPPPSPAAPVRLPAPARPGEHPRLLLTPAEVAELKAQLPKSERGRAALKGLLGVADAALASPPAFPDPKGPLSQLKRAGDQVAARHDRLSLNAGSLGIAYALTGNGAYARRAAEILRGYAQRYADYPEHKGVNANDTGKVMSQRLSEAMWLIPLIQAYDYVYDSGALTVEDRESVETRLIRPAIAFIRSKDPAAEVAARDRDDPNWRTAPPPKGGASNWLLFYNAATMMAGAVMDDPGLKDLAAADFRRLLANGIGSDGMWNEGAIGYQFFALSALVGGVETAARQGIDLWSFDGNRLKRLFDSPLRYAYPDGSAPGINDSGRTRFGDWSTMAYDYAYLRYGDPAYAFLVNASPRQLHLSQALYFPARLFDTLPETRAGSLTSTVFESLGYAVLRGPRAYALMDYGPHGGVHGHPDKLNLVLYAAGEDGKGDEMGGEPRLYRYDDPLHPEWSTRTVAHNTMTVDETSQVPSEGELLVFEDTPAFRVMRARTTASVPGALLDRTVVVTPDAVIDLFRGRSGFRRTWDRTLRFQGALAGIPAAAAASAATLGTRDGYQHLRVLQAKRPADRGWEGVWQTKVGGFRAALAGAPGQSVTVARGPDDGQMALARQEGEGADFAVAYALEGWPNRPESVRWLPTGEADTAAAEVRHADGAVTTVFVAHGGAGKPWKALGWSSDARVLCVRRKGGDVKLLLTGGTFAEGDRGAAAVRRPAPGNYAAESRPGAVRLEVVSAWTPAAAAAAPLPKG